MPRGIPLKKKTAVEVTPPKVAAAQALGAMIHRATCEGTQAKGVTFEHEAKDHAANLLKAFDKATEAELTTLSEWFGVE